jgi:hypothetical protein
MQDTIALVAPLPFNRAALTRVLERKLHGPRNAPCLSKAVPAQTVLERDLESILEGRKPRLYGEMPAVMGDYTRLCPGTAVYERAEKLKRRAYPSQQQR